MGLKNKTIKQPPVGTTRRPRPANCVPGCTCKHNDQRSPEHKHNDDDDQCNPRRDFTDHAWLTTEPTVSPVSQEGDTHTHLSTSTVRIHFHNIDRANPTS